MGVKFGETVKAQLFKIICERIAGGETLKAITRGTEIIPGQKNPDRNTVVLWTLKNEEWAKEFKAAGIAQLDFWRDEMIDICDDESRDQVPDGKGGYKSDNTSVNRDRLKVDTRKWIMCKLHPERYGDKVGIEGDKDKPITVHIKIV